MPHITARGLQVYYEIAGDGPRLLFIGGTGGDLRVRPNVFDRSLPNSFTVLAYDQRGLGRTSVPPGPYSMCDYAEDASALLDAVGWDDCLVMGVSFGGMVAQELALRFPNRVQKLVLCCTSSGGAGGASYPLHELTHLPPRERARQVILLSNTRRDAAWEVEHLEELDQMIEFALAARAVGEGEDGREDGARLQLDARRAHDTYDRLPSLSMPVLVCGGKYDGIAPPDNSAALARQLARAELEMFEGGHLFLIEDGRAVSRIIHFLTATSAGSA